MHKGASWEASKSSGFWEVSLHTDTSLKPLLFKGDTSGVVLWVQTGRQGHGQEQGHLCGQTQQLCAALVSCSQRCPPRAPLLL